MKEMISKYYPLLVGAAVLAMMSSPAWAHHHKKGPCAPVWKACVQAGNKGQAAKQCVETIKSGGTVNGVTVSDSDLQACRATSNGSGGGSGNGNGGN